MATVVCVLVASVALVAWLPGVAFLAGLVCWAGAERAMAWGLRGRQLVEARLARWGQVSRRPVLCDLGALTVRPDAVLEAAEWQTEADRPALAAAVEEADQAVSPEPVPTVVLPAVEVLAERAALTPPGWGLLDMEPAQAEAVPGDGEPLWDVAKVQAVLERLVDMEPAVEAQAQVSTEAVRAARNTRRRLRTAAKRSASRTVAALSAAKEPAKAKGPTVAQLREQAKAKGLTGYSRLAKAQLVALLAGQ